MVRKKVKVRTLESLVEKLNFISKAVRDGRAFNRRFYDAMVGISNPDFYVRLNSAVKQDVKMWLSFFVDFDGTVYFSQREWTSCRVLQLCYR